MRSRSPAIQCVVRAPTARLAKLVWTGKQVVSSKDFEKYSIIVYLIKVAKSSKCVCLT